MSSICEVKLRSSSIIMPRALLLLTLETGTSSITTGREGVGNNFSYCKRPYILFLWDLSLFAISYTMIGDL